MKLDEICDTWVLLSTEQGDIQVGDVAATLHVDVRPPGSCEGSLLHKSVLLVPGSTSKVPGAVLAHFRQPEHTVSSTKRPSWSVGLAQRLVARSDSLLLRRTVS